ncbi:unnamed protein product [Cercospora beticola]|nr:unnamed protein product [Cercospora beticola]
MRSWRFLMSSKGRRSGEHCRTEADSNRTNEQHLDTQPPHVVPDARDSRPTFHHELEQPAVQEGEALVIQGDITQELRRQYVQLLRRRARVEHIRVEAQQALQQSSDARRFFHESKHELMKYIRDQGGGYSLDQPAFLTLCDNMLVDSDTADAKATTAKNLQGKLSSHEYRLRESESAFSKQLDEFLKSTGAWDSTQLDQVRLENTSTTTSQSTLSPILDPLLQTYYDKAGDVRLLGEELADLDVEHQQALSIRALERDQGKTPSETESCYERSYQASRAALEKQFGDALAAADAIRRQYFSEISSSLPDLPLDEFVLPEPLFEPRSPEQNRESNQDATSTAASSRSTCAERKQEMVLEWANQIQEIADKPPIRPVTNEEVDGKPPTFLVTQEDVDAMQRIDLDKWGYVHVQRPRRHSSVSHLRWKVNEANKHL